MNMTGMVRRIDELGRIVIPKEIRKNLRIGAGENLEFYIENDNIVLKRYMMMNKLEGLAQNFADAIYELIKKNVVITDIEKIIAYSGTNKKKYYNQKISNELLVKIQRRESILEKYTKNLNLTKEQLECSYVIDTITINGDAVGLIILFSLDEQLSDIDYKIVKIINNFFKRFLSN